MTVVDPGLVSRRSLEVLLDGQAPSGAFVASPAFPVYHYAWLRDGAFCAHALDVIGERAAAAAFHRWAGNSIETHRALVEHAIRRVDEGETPPPEAMPPARYTLDGTLERPGDEPWPNFQIDGYGMWLWALGRHETLGRLDEERRKTVELVAEYLRATWPLPCFNCWEEFDGGEHASTFGAVVAGLDAAARLLDAPAYAEEADRVRAVLLDRFRVADRFRRGAADDRVDGSMLWLGVPFGVLPPTDPLIAATVDAVRSDLATASGGVYRYLGDTYYGGGEWLLLTSSLAWHDALTGDAEGVRAAQEWVRAQAAPDGNLPEQVSEQSQAPEMVDAWLRRWGPIAAPLLWSHAMYVIAETAAQAHL